MRPIRTITVLGAGLMGHGIAQVFAEHDLAGRPYDVRVFDVATEALATVRARIASNLESLGRDPAAAARVRAVSDLVEAVRDADLVIEAVSEDLAVKHDLLRAVEAAVADDAVLASNTSVIPITQVMSVLRRPARALGTHWWNPPDLVPLVEVIGTEATREDVVQGMIGLLSAIGKTPVRVRKDVAGFIGNRLQHALWREAINLVAEGICDAETVDLVVKSSFGRRLDVLGPLENADLVGTDLTLAIHETIVPTLCAQTSPSPYLRSLVEGGRLGMKAGRGFREWTRDAKAETLARLRERLSRPSSESPLPAHDATDR